MKAFLQVGLQEVDRDYTRFLWVKDMEAQPVKFEVFRFRSVLFGSTASPFLLQATLTKHLSESENSLGEKIFEQFYVDNFQGTCDTREELFNIFHNANCGGFFVIVLSLFTFNSFLDHSLPLRPLTPQVPHLR